MSVCCCSPAEIEVEMYSLDCCMGVIKMIRCWMAAIDHLCIKKCVKRWPELLVSKGGQRGRKKNLHLQQFSAGNDAMITATLDMYQVDIAIVISGTFFFFKCMY